MAARGNRHAAARARPDDVVPTMTRTSPPCAPSTPSPTGGSRTAGLTSRAAAPASPAANSCEERVRRGACRHRGVVIVAVAAAGEASSRRLTRRFSGAATARAVTPPAACHELAFEVFPDLRQVLPRVIP